MWTLTVPQALTGLEQKTESCTATVLRASLRRVSANVIRRLYLCYRKGGYLPTSHVTLHVFDGLLNSPNVISRKRSGRQWGAPILLLSAYRGLFRQG